MLISRTVVDNEDRPVFVINEKLKMPHTIKEKHILLTGLEMVEVMFGNQFGKQLKFIPSSSDTAARQICDIAEDIFQNIYSYSI